MLCASPVFALAASEGRTAQIRVTLVDQAHHGPSLPKCPCQALSGANQPSKPCRNFISVTIGGKGTSRKSSSWFPENGNRSLVPSGRRTEVGPREPRPPDPLFTAPAR